MPQPDINKTTKPSRLKNFAKNFSLILLSLIFALSICEITLRFYNPFGFRIKGDNIVLPVNKTEILHHGKCTKIDALVVHHNNSLGFKGPEPPKDFADWLTMVTVGGSTTECLEIAATRPGRISWESNYSPTLRSCGLTMPGFAANPPTAITS